MPAIPNREHTFAPAVIIFAVTFLFLSPVLNAVFIWDDALYIIQPIPLKSWGGIYDIWTQPYSTPSPYPLVMSAFWAMYRVWGEHPVGYHAVGLLLHAVNAILLWRLLFRLNISGALLASLLFAIHPIQVESVAHVSELKNTLSGFFFFLAIHAWLRFEANDTRNNYLALVGLFTASMLSKTVTCVLPPLLGTLILWRRPERMTRRLLQTIPLYALALALAGLTIWWEKTRTGASSDYVRHSISERIWIAARALEFYLGKLAWPFHLQTTYPKWNLNLFEGSVSLIGLTLVLCGLVFAMRNRAASRSLTVALASFAILIFPALGFFDFSTMYYSYAADHYAYLSSAVPFAVVAALVSTGLRHSARIRQAGIPALAIFALGMLSAEEAWRYRDAALFWESNAKQNPKSPHALYDWGLALMMKNENEAGAEKLREAVKCDPDYVGAHVMLARAALERNDKAGAKKHYALAVAVKAGNEKLRNMQALAHNNLATLLAEEGKHEQAIKNYEAALKILPRYPQVHVSMALLYGKQGDFREAARHCRRAANLDPLNADAQFWLGRAEMRMGHPKLARNAFARALEINPNYPNAREELEKAEAAMSTDTKLP